MSARDIIVKILVTLHLYEPIVNLTDKLKFRIQAHRMRKNGLQMFYEANKALTAINMRPFLVYGTLLGAYREHGFISYDPDIDLGVFETEISPDMHSKMQAAGFQLVKQIYIGDTQKVVEETYEYQKIHLDIFIYMKDGEDWYSVIQHRHETKEWKEANATDGFPCERSYVPDSDLERIDFMGISVYIPEKADEWLRAMYSDSYMTPVKNWSPEKYPTRRVMTEERSYRKLF